MLRKYIKHEFYETGKLMIPLNLVIIVYTILGAIMLGSRLIMANTPMVFIGVISLVLYVLSLIAIFIVAYVYFTVRFYKTMYQSQGYLTHTLPLSTMGIVNTKLLVSACWMVLTVVITTLSIVALVASAIGREWGQEFYETFNDYSSFTTFSFAGFSLWYFFLLVLGCLQQLLMIYASLAIGQLCRQYRVLASIGAFIAFYMAIQVVNTVIMFVTQLFSINDSFIYERENEIFSQVFGRQLTMSTIMCILLCILFYFLCYWLTDKKLNLE
ncbi:MAG: hypothetical protein NC307_06000 [Roseburia sp.]|nr:hypothetical protein [Roseburia sp.]